MRRKDRENDLNRELRDHLDLEAAEQASSGVPPGEAQPAARRAFGNTARVQEDVRAAWGWMWIERLLQDVRQALRVLRLNPGFASIAVVALGLGVGANTALYSILNAIWLKQLPVAQPGQLVVFSTSNTSFSYPAYREFRDHARTLQGIVAYRTLDANVGAERNKAVLVSGNYFSVLGVRMAVGAGIAEEGPVAVLSHGFWQRRFGADPGIVGTPVSINGAPFTVVGVAQPGFSGTEVGELPDIFVPMKMQSVLMPNNPNALEQRRNVWLRIMGRLRPDVTVQQAEAELTVLVQRFNQPDLATASAARRKRLSEERMTLLPGGAGTSGLRRRYSQPLTILMSVAGFVLLIACANVASLLLTRATGRQHEIAVRVALGATRSRLVSQLMAESLVIALLGSALGLVLSRWVRDTVLLFLPQAANIQVTLDAPVLGFSLLLGIATGLLFGFAPALQATRPGLLSTRVTARSTLRKGLVVMQVALSLILLTGAGVFIRSLRNLELLDPGFVRENVLLFSVDAKLSGYSFQEAKLVCDRLLDRVRALPGVRSAGMADFAPLGMRTGNTIYVEGYQPRPDEPTMDPGAGTVTPGYFATMGIPVLLGRDLTVRDSAAGPKVAIVNETFARHYFGGSSPIGRRIGHATKDRFDIEIVGVVRDSKYGGLRERPVRMVYFPASQRGPLWAGGGVVHVRTAGDPAAMAALIRAEVRGIDANLPIVEMKTVQQEVDRVLAQDRLVATLSTMFSTLALILSAVGLYGAMSYAVSRRTREIGIRMALGAKRGDIARRVLKEAAALTLAGVLVGLPAAYAVLSLVSSMLFGLTPHDPASAAIAIGVLAAAALSAAWIPARRASRVDPIVALRIL